MELHKSLSHEIKEVELKQGIVTAYANVYNFKDSDGDISAPGSFTKAVKDGYKRIRVLKDHDRYTSLGVPLSIDTEDSFGLKTVSQFNLQKQIALDMLSDIALAKEHGLNAELSIGYGGVKRDSTDKALIKEYGWLGEYSFLSSWAANELSVVESVKSLGDAATVQEVMNFLAKMYNLPHSDMRLKQVEDALSLLEKNKDGVEQKVEEKSDTIVSMIYDSLFTNNILF